MISLHRASIIFVFRADGLCARISTELLMLKGEEMAEFKEEELKIHLMILFDDICLTNLFDNFLIFENIDFALFLNFISIVDISH